MAPRLSPAFALVALAASAHAQCELDELASSQGAELDSFGISAALEDRRAVVGAPEFLAEGSAYVFERGAFGWVETQRIAASDGRPMDGFGFAVALSGGTILVGAWRHSGDGGAAAGAAYVFELVGGTWIETQKLVASDAHADQGFGRSVALRGDVALVGAFRDAELGNEAGAAYVFERTSTGWVE